MGAGNNQKITMLGYPMPTASFTTAAGECPGSSPSTLEALNGAMQDACTDVGATYINMRDIAGGNATFWSALSTTAGSFHADQVHLNEKGYCKVAISDTFRARFNCTVVKTDQSCFSLTPPPGVAKGVVASNAARASWGFTSLLMGTAAAAALVLS